MDRIAQDEQRHIAFGVKLLSDVAAGDPECRRAVADLLREVLPWTASVLVPPGWNLDYTRVFGFELEDIAQEGADSLETKLRSAGLPIEELPGPPIFAYGLPPETRVRNGLRLVQSGVLGEKNGPPKSDHDTMAALFELLGREHRTAQCAGRARHDPVGLRRCRALASRGRQRRHAVRARSRRGAHGHAAVPLRGLGGRVRKARAPAAAGGHAPPAPERRHALAVARAPHVPALTAPISRFGRPVRGEWPLTEHFCD